MSTDAILYTSDTRNKCIVVKSGISSTFVRPQPKATSSHDTASHEKNTEKLRRYSLKSLSSMSTGAMQCPSAHGSDCTADRSGTSSTSPTAKTANSHDTAFSSHIQNVPLLTQVPLQHVHWCNAVAFSPRQ
jgi:hypothetical protein